MKKLVCILTVLLLCILQHSTVQSQVNNQQLKQYIYQIVSISNKAVFYNQLDSIHKLKGLNTENTVSIKVHLAREAIRLQKYAEGLKLSYEGLDIAKKYGYDSAHAAFYKSIGTVSYYTSKMPEAIAYFKKSLAIAEAKNIIILQVANYQNIGGVSIDNKQIDSAYKYLTLAINTSNKCHGECMQFRLMALRLLATLYDNQKEYTKASKLFSSVEAEAVQTKDTMVIASVLLYHAKVLSTLGKKQLAIEKSETALKLMRQFKGGYDHGFYATLAQLAARRDESGDYKEASKLKTEMLQMQSRKNKMESEEQIGKLETVFKVKEIEQEKNIATANALAETQKKKLLTLILIAVILLAVLAIVTIYFINKKKQAEAKITSQKRMVASILETEEKERSRIAKDLHDGIVQDLTAIKFSIQSITQTIPQQHEQALKNILQEIDTTSKEVREISYQMMPITLKELGLLKAINELLNRSLTKNNIHFDINSFGITERLPEKIETTIYRICQELINNTLKHSQANHVSVLLQLRNNMLQLTYEDNGIGFNTTNIKKGIGLNSLSSRIEMVKGSLEIDASATSGTTAYIRIPL